MLVPPPPPPHRCSQGSLGAVSEQRGEEDWRDVRQGRDHQTDSHRQTAQVPAGAAHRCPGGESRRLLAAKGTGNCPIDSTRAVPDSISVIPHVVVVIPRELCRGEGAEWWWQYTGWGAEWWWQYTGWGAEGWWQYTTSTKKWQQLQGGHFRTTPRDLGDPDQRYKCAPPVRTTHSNLERRWCQQLFADCLWLLQVGLYRPRNGLSDHLISGQERSPCWKWAHTPAKKSRARLGSVTAR